MKVLKFLMLFTITISLCIPSMAQRRKKSKGKEVSAEAIKLYTQVNLPESEISRLTATTDGKKYAYFISMDGEDIPNRSLTNGPQEIQVLPGEHTIQVRFIAKGELAIPIEPFESFKYEAGIAYLVKFEYSPGKGSYIDAADSTRIKIWVEDLEGSVLLEMTVDGFGKSITN